MNSDSDFIELNMADPYKAPRFELDDSMEMNRLLFLVIKLMHHKDEVLRRQWVRLSDDAFYMLREMYDFLPPIQDFVDDNDRLKCLLVAHYAEVERCLCNMIVTRFSNADESMQSFEIAEKRSRKSNNKFSDSARAQARVLLFDLLENRCFTSAFVTGPDPQASQFWREGVRMSVGDGDPTSNMYTVVGGVPWNGGVSGVFSTVEKCYQLEQLIAAQAPAAVINEIMGMENPFKIKKKVGELLRNPTWRLPPDFRRYWSLVKGNFMFQMLKIKFRHCPEFRLHLCAALDRKIEHPLKSDFWGSIGGANVFGQLLEIVRDMYCRVSPGADFIEFLSWVVPVRHGSKKLSVWKLPPVVSPLLILGDSNPARIPKVRMPGKLTAQIESYPGARIADLTSILSMYSGPMPRDIILNIGQNNVTSWSAKLGEIMNDVDQLIACLQNRFPGVNVYFNPVTLHQNHHSETTRSLADEVNDYVADRIVVFQNFQVMPSLPSGSFNVVHDGVHWDENTARNMFYHWLRNIQQ